MTFLLLAASIVALFMLIASAGSTFAKATTSDTDGRGPWGIVYWSRERRRDLDPHERRWQTALLSGKDSNARWGDVVAEIETLEYLSNVTSSPEPPASYDHRWIEDRLANLETIIDERTQPGAP